MNKIGLQLIPHLQGKVKLIKELAEQLPPLCEPGVVPVDASTLKWNKDPVVKEKIKDAIRDVTKELHASISKNELDHAKVDLLLRATSEKFGLKLGDLTQPMRLFVTGQATSAIGLFDLLPILPWDVTEARLQACVQS